MSSEIFEISQHKRLNWTTTIAMTLFHLGAIAALFVFSWQNLVTAVFLYWVATGLGISLGYHRLHTHRSYKAPRLLEYFLAICGSLTLEGGPITWVAAEPVVKYSQVAAEGARYIHDRRNLQTNERCRPELRVSVPR